jgi:hypothetical protein
VHIQVLWDKWDEKTRRLRRRARLIAGFF